MSPKDELMVMVAISLREMAPDDETFKAAMQNVDKVASEMVNSGTEMVSKGGKKASSPSVKPSPFRRRKSLS